MKDFLQTLQDAFPVLKNHPLAMARLLVLLLALVAFWTAKEARKKYFGRMARRLYERIVATNRWLYVYQATNHVNAWKYYTSENTGSGNVGDDIVWSLIKYPSMKPIDSFRIQGAVGMLDAAEESLAKLQGRWRIKHDFDRHPFGMLPAYGLRSKLRRVAAPVCLFLAGGWDEPEGKQGGSRITVNGV